MTTVTRPARLQVFPESTTINNLGHLTIGGCDSVELVQEFGSPLYVFDEAMLRGQCRAFRRAFEARLPAVMVAYASKAYLGRALAQLVKEEGLGCDVVSGGELAVIDSVDFPMDRVVFHGNNKTPEELRLALRLGVGRIAVDNFHELALLNDLALERDGTVQVLVRVTPGIDPHTHAATTTGITDSKFGFNLANGQAEEAVARVMSASHLELRGLHCHLGSPIFELEPYRQAVEVMFEFAARMRDRYRMPFHEFSPGGGFAVQYLVDAPAPGVDAYAEAIATAIHDACARWGFAVPRVIVEPGRAIVGRAGVALYRVGAIKDIPGVRRYVSVDGGMADNIRPAIYGARYEAVAANRAEEPDAEVVTIAGKYCESGDILIRDIALPRLCAGDVLAVPTSGAYCLAMASSYNAALKPAIVMVHEGEARLIRRRETYEDLMRCDLV